MSLGRIAIFFLALALILFALWLAMSLRQQRPIRNVSLTSEIIINTISGDVRVPVELAITIAERTQGLSDREFLPEGSGMLFLWNKNISVSFVMRRMNFPLDIIFIKGLEDGIGEIVNISNDLPQCPGKTSGCTTASASIPFQYVLEVNGGFSKETGIKVGDKTRFSQ